MLGFLLLLLLAPYLLYWASQYVVDEESSARVYFYDWVKSSTYHVCIALACLLKAILPSTEETSEKLKELSVKDSLDKGIKEIWK